MTDLSPAELLAAAFDAAPHLTRVRGVVPFVSVLDGGRLLSGSVQRPDRPRVYRNGDTILMVAGTEDPHRVPFHQAWRVAS